MCAASMKGMRTVSGRCGGAPANRVSSRAERGIWLVARKNCIPEVGYVAPEPDPSLSLGMPAIDKSGAIMRISRQIMRIIKPFLPRIRGGPNMTRRVFAALSAFALPLVLAAAGPTLASAQTGRISGSVADSANMPLAGAQVTVTGTSLRSVSDDAGRFVISGVSPGTYEVRTQRVGQRAVTMAGVVVRANEETKLSVILGRAPIQVAASSSPHPAAQRKSPTPPRPSRVSTSRTSRTPSATRSAPRSNK